MKSLLMFVLSAMMFVATTGCEDNGTPMYITPTRPGTGSLRVVDSATNESPVQNGIMVTDITDTIHDGMATVWTTRRVVDGDTIDWLKVVRFWRELPTDSVIILLEARNLQPATRRDLEYWYNMGWRDPIPSSPYRLVALGGDLITSNQSPYPFFPMVWLPFVESKRELEWENGALQDGSQVWSEGTAFAVVTRPEE
jgi:hypothetical protein